MLIFLTYQYLKIINQFKFYKLKTIVMSGTEMDMVGVSINILKFSVTHILT